MNPWLASSLQALIGFGLLVSSGLLHAAAYRCDDGGRVTYTNLPCPSGRQTEVVDRAASPTARDRAAAEARNRADRAQLTVIEDTHERERRQDTKAAAVAARRRAGRGKEAAACSKLAVRAKRAHEDYERASPRDQSTQRTRMHRAEDDYAALCKKS